MSIVDRDVLRGQRRPSWTETSFVDRDVHRGQRCPSWTEMSFVDRGEIAVCLLGRRCPSWTPFPQRSLWGCSRRSP
eukprot:scaffold33258_cov62-Phaeocystis_antarctica.AAC.1